MAVLLLGAAVISGGLLRELVDAVAIAAIVLLNVGIAVAEEGRATRAIGALRALVAPTTTVRRDGRRRPVPAADVVPGDVVLLSAGDVVPADAELVAGVVEVDESVLTGESLPVKRSPASPGAARALVFSGTHVVRGAGTAVVTATAGATALGAIATGLSEARVSTPLQVELARVTKRLAVVAVAVAGSVFAVSTVRSGVEDAFVASVALAVAAVPEGLATVTALGLALGVRRMAASGAVVRRLPAVETLGATTVILTDKTGTLTEGRMALREVALAEGTPVALERLDPAARRRVAEVAVGCNGATLDPPTGDVLDLALLEAFATDGMPPDMGPAVAVQPFDAVRDRMATLHPRGPRWRVLVKGSPEAVLARCHTGDGERRRLLAVAQGMAATGQRVIALAARDVDGPQPRLAEVEDDLDPVALLGLGDPLRPEASATVAEAQGAGVRIVMVTGDHPATAQAVAAAVGIEEVHARVDPDEKLALVEQFRGQGEVVAVTGDGVNDAPALQRADIGVAMGGGSEVAREAADMVLTDDNLATVVLAVREGRGIYDNLRRVVYYLVAGNLSEIVVVLGMLVLFPAAGVPLLPVQLLWVNLLTDGVPAIALGVAPPVSDLMTRRPRGSDERLLGVAALPVLAGRGAILASGPLTPVVVADALWELPFVELRTVAFVSLVLAHLLYALPVGLAGTAGLRNDGGRRLAAAVVLTVALQLMVPAVPGLASVLGAEGLGARAWVVVAIAGVLPPSLVALTMRSGPWPLSRHRRRA
jgi:Ca2+-transporting ATPase